MPFDVAHWDQRYAAPEFCYGTDPNDFLREHAAALPAGGRVLCLGEAAPGTATPVPGNGRAAAALYGPKYPGGLPVLAARGCPVGGKGRPAAGPPDTTTPRTGTAAGDEGDCCEAADPSTPDQVDAAAVDPLDTMDRMDPRGPRRRRASVAVPAVDVLRRCAMDTLRISCSGPAPSCAELALRDFILMPNTARIRVRKDGLEGFAAGLGEAVSSRESRLGRGKRAPTVSMASGRAAASSASGQATASTEAIGGDLPKAAMPAGWWKGTRVCEMTRARTGGSGSCCGGR